MRNTILAIVFAAALAGCAARYGEMGFTGGVTAEQISADTWRIEASGNAYTSRSRVQDFALVKAAEVTKAQGAAYFAIAGAQDSSSAGTITTPATAQTTMVGRTAYTTISPGAAYSMVKPGQDLIIRVLRSPAPGAISADEIIQFVGPRLR